MNSKYLIALFLIALGSSSTITNQESLDFLQLTIEESGLDQVLSSSSAALDDTVGLVGEAALGAIPPLLDETISGNDLGVQVSTDLAKDLNGLVDLLASVQKELNNQLLELTVLTEQSFNSLLQALLNSSSPDVLNNLQASLGVFLGGAGSQINELSKLLENLVNSVIVGSKGIVGDVSQELGQAVGIVNSSVEDLGNLGQALAPTAGSVLGDLGGIGQGLQTSLEDTLNGVGQAANSVIELAGNAVQGLGGSSQPEEVTSAY